MNKRVIITVGISASGKTTWARKFTDEKWCSKRDPFWVVISRDDIRAQIVADKSPYGDAEFSWDVWNWKREGEVTSRQWEMIERCVNDPQIEGFIIADTNLNFERLELMKVKLRELNVFDIEVKYFPIDIDTAWKRDAARKNGVGHSVIAKQMNQWKELMKQLNMEDKTYKPNNKLPAAFMFDLDGTLAHMNGKRGPFEWHKVGMDEVDVSVAEILRHLSKTYEIIIMSGRDSICKAVTIQWLNSYDIPYNNLFMREVGDMRKDSIIKKELFWEHIAHKYNVMGVFDDRPQVVRMWQDIGLKTFAIGNQYIEF